MAVVAVVFVQDNLKPTHRYCLCGQRLGQLIISKRSKLHTTAEGGTPSDARSWCCGFSVSSMDL